MRRAAKVLMVISCFVGARLGARLGAQPAPARVGTVAGVVLVDSLNTPIPNADVRIGASDSTRTDSTGRFELLKVPAGVKQIVVRAIGYEPYSQTISVNANGRVELELPLRRDVQQLRAVNVAAAAVPNAVLEPWRAGFEDRKKFGLGHFVSGDQLAATDGKRWTTDLIARVPGLRLARWSGRTAFLSSRGLTSIERQPGGDLNDRKMGAPKGCYPIVIVDDMIRYGGGPGEPLFDLNLIDGTQIAAVEVYSVSSMPVRFNKGGNAACGAVVIWMKSH